MFGYFNCRFLIFILFLHGLRSSLNSKHFNSLIIYLNRLAFIHFFQILLLISNDLLCLIPFINSDYDIFKALHIIGS